MSFKGYRRFKRKYKFVHILVFATAVILFWRGVWGILDTYLFPDNILLSNLVSIGIAFVVLYLDDFHLKELE